MSIEEGLQDSGFQVVGASSAADARGAIELMGDAIGALVTNVDLGKSAEGWDVARRGRDLDPAIPVIYTTASRTPDFPSRAVENSIEVSMPFRIDQIVTALRMLFEEAAPSVH
jgi:DNA-binding NtrC family response regulator